MYKLNILILLLSWTVHSEQKTKITILYESLCPDSEVPLRNLQEGVGDFHNKRHEVDLELVPYGKAIVSIIFCTFQRVLIKAKSPSTRSRTENGRSSVTILKTNAFLTNTTPAVLNILLTRSYNWDSLVV